MSKASREDADLTPGVLPARDLASLTLAVVILIITTWYSIVIQQKPFFRDFVEILAILFATVIIVYALGYIVSAEFPGIKVI